MFCFNSSKSIGQASTQDPCADFLVWIMIGKTEMSPISPYGRVNIAHIKATLIAMVEHNSTTKNIYCIVAV